MMQPFELEFISQRRQVRGERLERPALLDPLLMAKVTLVTAILRQFDSTYERRLWMRQFLPVTARKLGLFEPVEATA